MERYLTLSEFKVMMEKVHSGKLKYKEQALKRIIALANETGTQAKDIVLYYLAEHERLVRENEDMKRALDNIRNSASGGMNRYQTAMKLGDVKPAYRKDVTVEEVISYKNQGYTDKIIALFTNSSVSTVRRRIKEYERNPSKYCLSREIKLDL